MPSLTFLSYESILLYLCAADAVGLARQSHHAAQLVQGRPCLESERGQDVAEIDRVVRVPIAIGP